MASADKQQYQHFIPQFILKNFSRPVVIDANASRAKRRKHHRKTGQYPDDYLMNSVNISSEPFTLEECVVRRSFGLFDMYDDDDDDQNDAKPTSLNRRRIEEKFGKLESRISKIYSRIITEHSQGNRLVWLTRTDKDLLRKWIFLLKYRGSGLHQRFRQDAKNYNDRDRDQLRNYMKQHNIKRPFDIWLHNLEAIIDLKMDPENEWKDVIRTQIYPPDAGWFIDQVTEMYMAICTPAKEDEEFILTENHCNIYEGPSTWVEDENTGEKMTRDSFRFHEFAPVSPKLMFVLRNGYMPGGSNDPDATVQGMRQAILTAIYNYFGPGTKSLLHDLPVCKAENSYTIYIKGQPHPKPGWDGRLRQDDNFGFPFFQIDTAHMQKMNGLLLDHAFHGTKIIYNHREGFLNLVKWFLEEPCEVGKNIEGAHADRHLRYVHDLAELMRSVGWEGQVVWKEWPNQKIPSMEAFRSEALARFLAMQAFMKGERHFLPEEVMLDLLTPYGRFPDTGLKGRVEQEDNHQTDVVIEKGDYNQLQCETKQQEQASLKDIIPAYDLQLACKQGHTQPQDSIQKQSHTEQDGVKLGRIEENGVEALDNLEQRDYDQESDAEEQFHVQQPSGNYNHTEQKHKAQPVNDAVLSGEHTQRSYGNLEHEGLLKPLTLPQQNFAPEIKPYKEENTDSEPFLDLRDAFDRIMLVMICVLLIQATICIAIVEMAIIALTGVLSGLNYIKSGLNNMSAIIHEHLVPTKAIVRRESVEERHNNPEIKTPSSLAKGASRNESHPPLSELELEPNGVPLEPKEVPLNNSIREMEPRRASEYVSLRSETAFPKFHFLPIDGGIDPFYFDTAGGFHSKPRRHWCFLAEIIDVENVSPLRLIVRDKAYQEIPIAFHTDTHGNELDSSSIKKGNTVAVLYAELHQFAGSSVGIRHTNPRMLKIFPIALEKLLGLGDRVQRYNTVEGDRGICQGCDRKADSLKRCTKCLLFRYCDKTCQSIGWNDKGHKTECKIMRDLDLQGLLRLNWDTFEEYHRFFF